MNAKDLEMSMWFVVQAHNREAVSEKKRFRKWDGKTPYSVHPIWCALTILTEGTLLEELRERGALALLYHDILEDTTAKLPAETPEEVAALVRGMTFESTDEEMDKVWDRGEEVILLKLYDKVSNLLDGHWMVAETRERYASYTSRLLRHVERRFGELNITRMARAVAGEGGGGE